VDVNAKDKQGRTPLKWVQQRGHNEVADLLRKHWAKKELRESDGFCSPPVASAACWFDTALAHAGLIGRCKRPGKAPAKKANHAFSAILHTKINRVTFVVDR